MKGGLRLEMAQEAELWGKKKDERVWARGQ